MRLTGWPLLLLLPFLASGQNPPVLSLEEIWNEEKQQWVRLRRILSHFDDQERLVYREDFREWQDKQRIWGRQRWENREYLPTYDYGKEYRVIRQGEDFRYRSTEIQITHWTEQGPIYWESKEEYSPELEWGQNRWTRQQTQYDPDGSYTVSGEYYDYDSREWKPWPEETYFKVELDAEGCRQSETRVDGVQARFRVLYQRDPQCRVLESRAQNWNAERKTWVNTMRDSLSYQNGTISAYKFRWQEDVQSWQLLRWSTRTDPLANGWEEGYLRAESGSLVRFYLEFNEQGNIIYQMVELKQAGDTVWTPDFIGEYHQSLGPNQTFSYGCSDYDTLLQDWTYCWESQLTVNEWQDPVKVVFLEKTQQASGTLDKTENVRTWEYDYYCDGQAREILEYRNGQPATRMRLSYLYPADCSDQSPTTDYRLFPNPTFDYAYLRSSFSESGATQLLVTDSQGNTIIQREIDHRAGWLEIDLHNRPVGVYLVWVFEKDGARKLTGKLLRLD